MKPSKFQLNELLSYLPAFETSGREFGKFHEMQQQKDGSFILGWNEYDPDVIRFFECASQPCFMDTDYPDKNPGEWMENSDFLKTASLEQCITCLTYCNRGERFSDGFWMHALETGIIQNILRRMQALRDQVIFDKSPMLLGAIAGDVIGSVYEHHSTLSTDFPLFSRRSRLTDDSVLTIAVADAIVNGGGYGKSILAYGRHYPDAGYGGSFRDWLAADDPQPYRSYGNGSAMRVSPVGWAFNTLEEVLREAERSAAVTHNHPEGIKGAQAVALAIFLARSGIQKGAIKIEIESRFGYDLSRRLDDIRRVYKWDVTCQGSVPESIIAFLEAENFEGAIRNAISLGGDADTMAAIAGSIAEAYYGGVPEEIAAEVLKRIPAELQEVLAQFSAKYSR